MEKQKTILVVEDEKVLRDIIVEMLNRSNYLPLEAVNGEEAVKMALSSKPDLILLDLLMPVMDGMTALKLIRADTWGAHVPVIILTNLSATDEQLVENMVSNKPSFYLIKSDWKIQNIIGKIDEILSEK
jgi:CheY-like chemotaxis protein